MLYLTSVFSYNLDFTSGAVRPCKILNYNRSPTSVGTFDVNGAAHVASRMLAAILLASKNGEFDRVLLGSSLQNWIISDVIAFSHKTTDYMFERKVCGLI